MTSISTSMSGVSRMSPNDRMKLQLQSAVSAGTIDATDQSALSSALDDIDTAIRSGGAAQNGGGPSGMKDRIDSLIDQEVSDGKLTDEQASELKELFAKAAPQGPGGPPAAEAAEEATDILTATSAGSADTSAASGTEDGEDLVEALMAFLQKFQEAMSSNATYAADGGPDRRARPAIPRARTCHQRRQAVLSIRPKHCLRFSEYFSDPSLRIHRSDASATAAPPERPMADPSSSPFRRSADRAWCCWLGSGDRSPPAARD